MGQVKRFFKWLDGSKKAKAAVLSVLVALLAPVAERFNWSIEYSDVAMVWGSLMVYLVAQGAADVGKEAKKLELEEEAEDDEGSEDDW